MKKHFSLLTAALSLTISAMTGWATAVVEPTPPFPTYTLTALVPDSLYSSGTAINNLGEVIGTYKDAAGNYHEFLYRRDGQLVDLTAVLGSDMSARFINNFGVVAGYSFGSLESEIFVYENGKIRYITPPDGAVSTFLAGFNDFGQMVGFYSDSRGVQHSFFRQPNGKYIFFPNVTTSVGQVFFLPTGVNDLGQTCGYASNGKLYEPYVPDYLPVFTAFLFDSPTRPARNLGSLNGMSTFATAINNVGMVTGESMVFDTGDDDDPAFYPFIYFGGKMVNVGPAVFGPNFIFGATGINDAGMVVGTEVSFAYDVWGFLYTKGTIYERIQGLIVPDPFFSNPSYFVDQVTGINDFGVILAESGEPNNPGAQVVILTPIPAPKAIQP